MSSTPTTWFDVDETGLLTDTSVPDPRTRAEVFERIGQGEFHDADGLIELIRSCQPLANHFRRLSLEYMDDIADASEFLRNLPAQNTIRTGTQHLILRALQKDPEEGWEQWVEYSGDASLEAFRHIVHDWLGDEIDWCEHDHFDNVWNGQTAAFGYFLDMPRSTLKELGLRLSDGGRPGRQVAELTKDLVQTNELAKRLGLPCRFCSASPAAAAVVSGAKHV